MITLQREEFEWNSAIAVRGRCQSWRFIANLIMNQSSHPIISRWICRVQQSETSISVVSKLINEMHHSVTKLTEGMQEVTYLHRIIVLHELWQCVCPCASNPSAVSHVIYFQVSQPDAACHLITQHPLSPFTTDVSLGWTCHWKCQILITITTWLTYERRQGEIWRPFKFANVTANNHDNFMLKIG